MYPGLGKVVDKSFLQCALFCVHQITLKQINLNIKSLPLRQSLSTPKHSLETMSILDIFRQSNRRTVVYEEDYSTARQSLCVPYNQAEGSMNVVIVFLKEALLSRDSSLQRWYEDLRANRLDCFGRLKAEQWKNFKDWRTASLLCIIPNIIDENDTEQQEEAEVDDQGSLLSRTYSCPQLGVRKSSSTNIAQEAFQRLFDKSTSLNEHSTRMTMTLSVFSTVEKEHETPQRYHSLPKKMRRPDSEPRLQHSPASGLADYDPSKHSMFPIGLNADCGLWLDCVSGTRLISNQMIYCEQCSRFHILARHVQTCSFLNNLHGWFSYSSEATVQATESSGLHVELCSYVQSFLMCVARALVIEAGTDILNYFRIHSADLLCPVLFNLMCGLVRGPDNQLPVSEDAQLLRAYTILSERCVLANKLE